MRIARFAVWTCALAVVLMAGAPLWLGLTLHLRVGCRVEGRRRKGAHHLYPGQSAIPGALLTGTVNDVPVGDAKTGLTLGRCRQSGRPKQNRH